MRNFAPPQKAQDEEPEQVVRKNKKGEKKKGGETAEERQAKLDWKKSVEERLWDLRYLRGKLVREPVTISGRDWLDCPEHVKALLSATYQISWLETSQASVEKDGGMNIIDPNHVAQAEVSSFEARIARLIQKQLTYPVTIEFYGEAPKVQDELRRKAIVTAIAKHAMIGEDRVRLQKGASRTRLTMEVLAFGLRNSENPEGIPLNFN